MNKYKTNYKAIHPYCCILCNSSLENFTTLEHIVPHSLGNNFLTLGKGYVCDKCNNICSGFESKAVSHTILGHERVLLGVTTKKGKPARSYFDNIYWYTEKDAPKNTFYVDKNGLHKNKALQYHFENNTNALILLYHNKYDTDISKLLLKIGIEFLSVMNISNFNEAKAHIISKDNSLWPYVLIQNKNDFKFDSIFKQISNYLYSHALASNFDLSFYEIEDDTIIFFEYGRYLYGINLSSRELTWLEDLKDDNIKYIVSPIEFADSSYT